MQDPAKPDRLLVYYEGVNVPHDATPGHSKYGLAYSPLVPAGMSGVGSVTTRSVDVLAGSDYDFQFCLCLPLPELANVLDCSRHSNVGRIRGR